MHSLVRLCCHRKSESATAMSQYNPQDQSKNLRQIPTERNSALLKNQSHCVEIDCFTILLNSSRQTGLLWIINVLPDNRSCKCFILPVRPPTVNWSRRWDKGSTDDQRHILYMLNYSPATIFIHYISRLASCPHTHTTFGADRTINFLSSIQLHIERLH